MNCQQAQAELIALLQNELDERSKTRLQEHLARCPACRTELENGRRMLGWSAAASSKPVLSAWDQLIHDSIAAKASDIHLETQRDRSLLVRIRVDGVLREQARFDVIMRDGLIARIKSSADMNIADVKSAQSGRIAVHIEENNYTLRVASNPMIYGEDVVIRIMEQTRQPFGLDEMGLSKGLHTRDAIDRLISAPYGVTIMTGPTGSGKTTTLYSIIQEIARPEIKVMTIENPVEYTLDMVNQAQVNLKAGYTQLEALRSHLLQDPDVIMMSELPDQETARAAMDAALMGHLLIVQLCAANALSAIQQLRDMDIPPYVLGATLNGVIAQRLVRKLCAICAKDVVFDAADSAYRGLGIGLYDIEGSKLRSAQGCDSCKGTGYRGRVAIHEVLELNRDLRAMVGNEDNVKDIETASRQFGYRPMIEDARDKVLSGITSAQEALRVVIS